MCGILKTMAKQLISRLIYFFFVAILSWSCSSTKHVPTGEYLVDNVKITVNDTKDVSGQDLINYLRQTPNHKVLGFFKIQLATYNLSGNDPSKWYNKWLRRMGQAPVIYDTNLTLASATQLKQALINRGYLKTIVEIDTIKNDKKKKIDVNYIIYTGQPYYISTLDYNLPDTTIAQIIHQDPSLSTIKSGTLLDRDILDAKRTDIAKALTDNGYYEFNKEYISFTADTALNKKDVNLTMNLLPPRDSTGKFNPSAQHKIFRIRDIYFVTDYNIDKNNKYSINAIDSVKYNNLTVIYGKDHYISPKILDEKCHIKANSPYNASQIDRTYESLRQLGILKSITINLRQINDSDNSIDVYIFLSRNKKQGITFDVEGTNSEGDLGFGIGLTYQHRNIAKGSELLTAKVRTAYESLSGNIDGLINNRYTEYAAEVGITFPKFKAPFLSKNFKQQQRAATEFLVSFNYQERPEYTRIIAGAAWKYKWNNRENTIRRTLDLIDINYVYLPKSTFEFIDQIAPSNPLLRYSYEDHFIMRMGYSYYKTNQRIATPTLRRPVLRPSIYALRASVEMAGNLLYAISSITGQKREDDAYKIFGIQYSQYVKADFDYTYTRNFDERNSLSFHFGTGIGYPYGNSSMIPFEKRFYAGGANGVRGWGVRSLGPGNFDSHNSVSDFINQCGDIRLDLSIEYRAKLFWILEGALFIDAGNIWTIHSYENQPGGMFHFNSFYKEIALSYGVGLRLDFSYFLLRLDLGMKAHNPARNQERWPIIHPKWGRDATFHFAVGYPF